MMNANIVAFPNTNPALCSSSQAKVAMALQHLAAAADLVDRTGVELMAVVPEQTGDAMLDLSLELHRMVDLLFDIYGLAEIQTKQLLATAAP